MERQEGKGGAGEGGREGRREGKAVGKRGYEGEGCQVIARELSHR
jgi:hypothetical protein